MYIESWVAELGLADAGDLGKLIELFYKREERVRAISPGETAVEQRGGIDKILEAACAEIATST